MMKSSEGVDKGKLACKINVYYRLTKGLSSQID